MQEQSTSLIDKIQSEAKNGNIVYFAAPNTLATTKIENFIKQPTEGILYDLNRDRATCLTWIKEGDMTWVNSYAAALVIEALKNKLEAK